MNQINPNTLPALIDDIPKENKVRYFFRLINLRKTHKMTQSDLAEILDVDQSYISMLETGRTQASAELLDKIAETFDVTLDYLQQDAYTIETAKQVIAEQVELIASKGLDISKADRAFLLSVIKTLQPHVLVEEKITQRVNEDGKMAYERALRKIEIAKSDEKDKQQRE